jgi:hypothetical protein
MRRIRARQRSRGRGWRWLFSAVFVASSTVGCQGERPSSPSGEPPAATQPSPTSIASPDVVADAPSTLSEPPFLTLWQRDDRDVIAARAFRPARIGAEVVLVSFRQPNRHHEAGFVVLLEAPSPGSRDPRRGAPLVLPANDAAPSGRPPTLTLLEAFGDPQGGLWVTDLVPSEDPLGASMVGQFHELRAPHTPMPSVVTRRMPPPPPGFRWAGPELVSVVDGAVTVVLAPTSQASASQCGQSQDAPFAGEAIFQPGRTVCGATPLARFFANKRSADHYRSWFQGPKHPLAGSPILTQTTCDADGCRTALRRDPSNDLAPRIAAHVPPVPPGGPQKVRLAGPDHTPPQGEDGSGSLQQRTPIE